MWLVPAEVVMRRRVSYCETVLKFNYLWGGDNFLIMNYLLRYLFICMFVCLFGVFVPLDYFSSIWSSKSITVSGKGLLLTESWHKQQLSSEGSLACHSSCDTRRLVIMERRSWGGLGVKGDLIFSFNPVSCLAI